MSRFSAVIAQAPKASRIKQLGGMWFPLLTNTAIGFILLCEKGR